MKRSPKYSKRFQKDYKKLKRSGKRDMEKLKKAMHKLVNREILRSSYHDHGLKGRKKGLRDCHIEGDWVLIYRIDKNPNGIEVITFERTGNHSNLFR